MAPITPPKGGAQALPLRIAIKLRNIAFALERATITPDQAAGFLVATADELVTWWRELGGVK